MTTLKVYQDCTYEIMKTELQVESEDLDKCLGSATTTCITLSRSLGPSRLQLFTCECRKQGQGQILLEKLRDYVYENSITTTTLYLSGFGPLLCLSILLEYL